MNPTCPNCGAALVGVSLGPATPPWLCTTCRHGWWDVEVTPESAAMWRPDFGDFGFGAPMQTLAESVQTETVAAVQTALQAAKAVPVPLPVSTAIPAPGQSAPTGST